MDKFILPIVILLTLTSCRQSVLFEDYAPIHEEQWAIGDTIRFQVDVPQKGDYDILLGVRHTTDYEMANLWCFMQVSDSTRTLFRDTLNIRVAEPDGRWLGKGFALKTVEYPSHLTKLDSGSLTFEIIQGMRMETLNGIRNVGLIIRPKNSHR